MISLRAAQYQHAVTPCVRGQKRHAYPPHAQREGYPLREMPTCGLRFLWMMEYGKPTEQSGGTQRRASQSTRSTAATDRPPLRSAGRRHKLNFSKIAVLAEHENRNSNDRPGFYPAQNTDHTNFYDTMCHSPATRRQITQTPPRPHIQREGAHRHCAARREIAERSEEAPGAKAAQPSWNIESWKTQAGCFGGVLRGGCKGGREGGAAP